MTHHEIAANIARLIPELQRDSLINNTELIEHKLRECLEGEARCIYCNTVFRMNRPEDKERMADHVLSCDKSPLVQCIKDMQQAVAEMEAAHKQEREALENQVQTLREWGGRCQTEMENQARIAMDLRVLIFHAYIHDNCRDCGFQQMTTAQKKLFVAILEANGMPKYAEHLKQFIAQDNA